MKRMVFVITLILGLSAIAMAQGQSSCQQGIELIRGTYLISYSGFLTIPDPTKPYAQPVSLPGAILGVMSIDSNGRFSGNATVAMPGSATDWASEGTLTLKPDCTGIMTFTNTDQSGKTSESEIDKFIAVVNGNDVEIHAIMKYLPGLSPVALGKWKRIAYKTNAAVW